MNKQTLRLIVGIGLVVSQLSLVAYVGSLTNIHLPLEEVVNVCLLLGPLFAAYTVASVKYFIHTAESEEQTIKVGLGISIIAIIYPAFMVLASFWIVFQFTEGRVAETVEDLRKFISGLQILLGAYVGAIIDWLFHFNRPLPRVPPSRSAR